MRTPGPRWMPLALLAALALGGCQPAPAAGTTPPPPSGSPSAALTPTPAPTAPQTATESPPQTAATPTASAGTGPAGATTPPADAVGIGLRYVTAIAAGDFEGAFALVTPRAQELLGGPEGLEEAMPDELGPAQWGAAPDLEARAVPVPSDTHPGLTVVEVLGTVSSEGITAYDVLPLAVVPTDTGEPRIDVLRDTDPIEWREPYDDTISAAPTLQAFSRSLAEVVLILDGRAVGGERSCDAEGCITSHEVSGGLQPGRHVVSAAVLDPTDGGVDATGQVVTAP